MIYRVVVKATASVQPAGQDTYWQRTVIYCGESLIEARIKYLENECLDYWNGYGNPARETIIRAFESEPEEIGDKTAHEAEVNATGD